MIHRMVFIVALENGLRMVFWIIFSYIKFVSLDAELEDLFSDVSIVKAHQHSVGAKKGDSNEIGHSCGGAKIHAFVGSYGYLLYFMISECQLSDMKFLISILQHISLQETTVLADKGYKDQSLMEYI